MEKLYNRYIYSSPCLVGDIFFKLANKYQIPYFTDDRSIFFSPQHAVFDLSKSLLQPRVHASVWWKSYIIGIFIYFVIIILYCKTIYPVIFFQQHTFFIVFNIRKNSIFNDWSVSENQFNIVLYNKIYTIKNVCCWKKITG
jgi:hypothetical protein